jgi:hypothetical protein
MALRAFHHLRYALRSWLLACTQGMYPGFVFGKAVKDIPVFYYHRIEQEVFRSHLHHLRTNNYRTLTGDALYHEIQHAPRKRKKSVVLTFDDGLDDLYTVIYPLLKEFQYSAMAYIIPGRVGRKGFVTWAQVREMHASGCLDFQSHSMQHNAIYTSPQIVDFVHRHGTRSVAQGVPVIQQGERGSDGEMPPSGTPIYASASRLSDARRYFPEQGLIDLCVSYVANNGGADFWRSLTGRSRLRKLVAAYQQQHYGRGTYETPLAQQQAIQYEIEESKWVIENHLAHKVVSHFAFPWHAAGHYARYALLRAGYKTMSIGLAKGSRHRGVGNTGVEIARLNGDFVPTLPGIGRQNFWRVMLHKLVRRLRSGPTY